MATVKVSSSKTCANAINYAKNKAVVMNGLNVDPKYAIGQMERVRQLYNKSDGVQAHLFIQSFAPGEVTSQQANELGMELAKAISDEKHYQVAVYTHNDTNHIHNHLVLNSVDFETGKKYQQSFDVNRVRDLSDSICEKHQLSVIKQKNNDKTPIAEIKAKEKGQYIWKDALRRGILSALNDSTTIDTFSFRHNLQKKGIDVRYRGEGLSFDFTDKEGKKRVSRGSKLGTNFEKKAVREAFKQNKEKEKERIYNPLRSRVIGIKEQISGLEKERQECLNKIYQGRKLEDEIRQQLSELTPQVDIISKKIDTLKLNSDYQKFNTLSQQHNADIQLVDKKRENFLNTNKINIFKKSENKKEWQIHLSKLQNSPIPSELKRLQPIKNQVDKDLDILTLQKSSIQNKISTLNYSLKTEHNIAYKNHYENQYKKLTYEINRLKSPGYEREVEERERFIIDHSQGFSL